MLSQSTGYAGRLLSSRDEMAQRETVLLRNVSRLRVRLYLILLPGVWMEKKAKPRCSLIGLPWSTVQANSVETSRVTLRHQSESGLSTEY